MEEEIRNVKRFYPNIEDGLNTDEINYRIKNNETNLVRSSSGKSYKKIVFDNVFTFFNIMMISIAILFISVVGLSAIGNLSFVLIVLCNMCIGTIQECKSKHTIEKLKLLSENKIRVIRNKEVSEIYQRDIVLDDIIILKAGDQVPVDCIVKSGSAGLNESLLTGESNSIKKIINDEVLAGSYLISGYIVCQANKVGTDTYIYSLESKSKEFKKPKSKLMTSLSGIIKTLTPITIIIGLIIFWKDLVNNQNIQLAVMSGGTAIVGMIPCGMILLASVAMETGVIRLSTHKTLVQDMYSVESLSRVDTLCLDKTGTLTDGTMVVENVIEFGLENINDLISSYLSAFETSNQTSDALLKKFGKERKYDVIDKIDFSSERKYSAVALSDGNSYALGAPEYLTTDKDILNKTKDFTKDGIRVLFFCRLSTKFRGEDEALSKKKTPLALILIRDNIRKEIVSTMEWFNNNDVDIRVISGDNIDTVSYISRKSGIKKWNKAVDLSTLDENSEEFKRVILDNNIFARVSPEQKAKIVKILKENNRTVAIVGDGINDILAMKSSDCAVALSNGAPATKNIANIVLLDSDFSNMPKAVYEGRRVVNNIQRSSALFLMKNFFFMFLSITSIALSVNFPVETSVMGLINIFITGISSLVLSIEPSNARIKGGFTRNVFGKAIPAGFFMFLPGLFLFIVAFIKNGLDINAVNAYMDSMVPVLSFCITIAGFVIFYRICKPFTKFRAILYTIILALVVFMILAIPEFFLNKSTSFWGDLINQYGNIMDAVHAIIKNLFSMDLYKSFSKGQWYIILGFSAICIPVYTLTDKYLSKFLDIYFDKKTFND